MERKMFDGRVIADVTGPNMRSIIVDRGFKRAVPEWTTFEVESPEAIIFTGIIGIVSQTKTLTIKPNETDVDILAMAAFWDFAQNSANYREIWEQFLYLDAETHNQWAKCVATSSDEKLNAPPEVQPNAPEDEVLEQFGQEGEDFLAVGVPI